MSEDLIKRSDAIKIMACEMYAEAQVQGYEVDNIEDFIPEAKAWMNDAPSADRPQGWIPCSERLPKPYTEVLVCDECGWISLGSYRPCDVTEKDSGWSTHTRIKMPTDEVVAWMPLPKPWKGADDE